MNNVINEDKELNNQQNSENQIVDVEWVKDDKYLEYVEQNNDKSVHRKIPTLYPKQEKLIQFTIFTIFLIIILILSFVIYTYSKKLINSTSDSRLRPHNYSDSFVRDKLNPIVKSVFGDDTEDYYTSDSDDLVACVFDQSVINLKDKVDILITKSPIDYTTVYMIQLPVDTYAEDFDEFENKVIQYSGAIEEFNKYECSMLNNS